MFTESTKKYIENYRLQLVNIKDDFKTLLAMYLQLYLLK